MMPPALLGGQIQAPGAELNGPGLLQGRGKYPSRILPTASGPFLPFFKGGQLPVPLPRQPTGYCGWAHSTLIGGQIPADRRRLVDSRGLQAL